MSCTKYKIKKTVYVNGVSYEIRSEYSVILTIFEAMTDPELSDVEKAYVVLYMFYVDFESIKEEDYQEALQRFFEYLGEEEENEKRGPKLVSWDQDFPYIVSAVNRVLGYDIRTVPYDFDSNTGGVPWETFISAYYEIGDCTFAQIVRIRDKKAKGKKLDKAEQEWYKNNRKLVDLKQSFSESEKAILKEWGV